MTVQEMVIQVGVDLRQVNSNSTKSYLDEEILLALNKAQRNFLASKVRKVQGKNFEYDIVDQEAISILLVKSNFGPITITNNTVSLPTELEYYIRASVDKKCGKAKVTLLKTSMVDTVELTPFYKSTSKNYNAELIGTTFKFYPHKLDPKITDVAIVYIRKPKAISVLLNQTSELEEKYHQAIVDLAVASLKVNNSQADATLKDQDNKTNSTLLG